MRHGSIGAQNRDIGNRFCFSEIIKVAMQIMSDLPDSEDTLLVESQRLALAQTVRARKQHVIEYRQQLAMMTLGWDATQAMATMRELLTSKSQYVRLEAARDLMDRAGFRQDTVRTPSTAVQINFNVD